MFIVAKLLSLQLDPDYLSFIEKTKEQPAILPSAEVQLDKRLAEEKEKIGTLTQFINITCRKLIMNDHLHSKHWTIFLIFSCSCSRRSYASHCDTTDGGH